MRRARDTRRRRQLVRGDSAGYRRSMTREHCDALVFFGATGDLAYKKIFPALQAMIRRGTLDMPVIGVAKAGWTLEQLKARARDSLEKHGGGVDPEAFAKLSSQLRYIDGDYGDDATFTTLRQTLGGAAHPLHYLAIPPSMFETVGAAARRERLCDGGAGGGGEAVWTRSRVGAGVEPRAARRVPGGSRSSGSTTTWARSRSRTSSSSGSPTRSSSRSGTAAT